MNKAEAKNIVINALDYKYEIKSFEAFLSNLFKNLTFFDKLKSKTPESFISVENSKSKSLSLKLNSVKSNLVSSIIIYIIS